MSWAWSTLSAGHIPAATTQSDSEWAFRVEELPTPTLGWIAKDNKNRTAFILNIREGSSPPNDSDYKHIDLKHNLTVEIQEKDNNSYTVKASVLLCKSDNQSTISLFERSVAGVLSNHTNPLDAHELEDLIESLGKLFGPLAKATEQNTLGLWGELFALNQATHTAEAFESWRLKDSDNTDFTDGQCRIDVKTTKQRTRRHHVTHSQLRPMCGRPAFVISIQTESLRTGGLSIHELWHSIADQLRPEQQSALDNNIVNTLGDNWEEDQYKGFDGTTARASYRIYDTRQVDVPDSLTIPILKAKYEINFDYLNPHDYLEENLPLLALLKPAPEKPAK